MQPDPQGVYAIAICTCGCFDFKVKIYTCGNYRIHCYNCDKAWEAPSWGDGQDTEGDQAVGEDGDVRADLVQTASRERENPIMTSSRVSKEFPEGVDPVAEVQKMEFETAQEAMAAAKKAIDQKLKFDKTKYQKDYMRKYRESKKK